LIIQCGLLLWIVLHSLRFRLSSTPSPELTPPYLAQFENKHASAYRRLQCVSELPVVIVSHCVVDKPDMLLFLHSFYNETR